MHLAILVYGSLDASAKHYENIVDSIGREHTIDFFGSSDHSNEDCLNDFLRLYQPISYTNEPIEHSYDLTGYPIEYNMENMIQHFINKDRVFTLMENTNTLYDVVISLRVDLLFHSPFLFNDIQENTIYIPEGNDLEGGLNEQLVYGKPDAMNKYMNHIHNCMYLLENRLSIVHSELLYLAMNHYNDLQVERPNLSFVIDK